MNSSKSGKVDLLSVVNKFFHILLIHILLIYVPCKVQMNCYLSVHSQLNQVHIITCG